ncbi:MAG: Rrf2 family transcriptional regulator [Bacteroidetes bacterium HGW-Bacteroidetes-9]|jgi:Rrf2 family protein|nr:MAG: Rrf2 family transcriptional regulator [Bacteroidetes bacterium HGW-Bacteroidetes-9]
MAKVVHISEAASLAVHGMVLIAGSSEILNVNQIADITHSSRNHLAKVMQILVKNGYLDSVRGPKGGFTLKGDPKKINLLEIYELIEGNIEEHHCGIETQKCPFDICVFGGLADKFSADFIEYLRNKTLFDLISKQ